jgi:hypothetical protein
MFRTRGQSAARRNTSDAGELSRARALEYDVAYEQDLRQLLESRRLAIGMISHPSQEEVRAHNWRHSALVPRMTPDGA